MSEWSAVQWPIIKYAGEIGWQHLTREQALALRGGEKGLYLNDILTAQLLKLNPGIVDETRAGDIVRQLNLLHPTIKGNSEALAWLRGENSVFVPSEGRERNVRLIDFQNPGNNIFHVTEEWVQQGVAYKNRADVVFLINGIPVAVCETKAAGKKDGMSEGVGQIRRYHKETPEMFTSAQVFEVTQLFDFFYGGSWNTARRGIFNWKEQESGNFERKVKVFFDQDRFLRLLRDYIVFLTKDEELSKIILSQHQTRAVEKVLVRVAEPQKRRGLVWHTQGSGKTLTMITIASRLLRGLTGDVKPTVLMLVDRTELEEQLFKNISAYGIGTVEVAQSKADLQRIFKSDYRGLVVSMIHKFDGIPANINTREGVVVLVDEAHRTTGGDLGNYLMAALPNATYIGFTGTPVDNLSKGKGTFKVFGGDDPQGYLDKYSIAESIGDGTTVELNYALAPSELRVDRETLEREFLDLRETEGIADVEELNAVLTKAVVLKEMMKSPGRVSQIAQFVAQHFRETVEPMGFKAFLVAVDREACTLYKQELDKHLPPEFSQVVISPAHNDGPELKAHYQNEEEEKATRKAFIKKKGLPKILIVTEKLLTGFDAPILYCMYLDKPMRDHVLLQAISRVNRPYEDEEGQVKPVGFVLDFVGIFEKIEKALAFDSDVVASVIQNIDVLKDLFARLMRDNASIYLPLARGWDDKAKERAAEYFADSGVREEFFTFFKQLQSLYDILSPDAFLRPYVEDFGRLAELYQLVRSAYADQAYVDKEFTEKVKALLRQHTELPNLELPGAIHKLGPKELAALREGDESDTTKVLNLLKILKGTAEKEGDQKPFLLAIGERAQQLAAAYEDRQLTTQQALDEFQKLAQEAVDAQAQREHLNVDENTFAIYVALRPLAPDITARIAQTINAQFLQYPDYAWNEAHRNSLRTSLYQMLRLLVPAKQLIEAANILFKLRRI